MTVSSGEQMNVFIFSLLAGIVCAIVFDWMRSCRKIFGCGKFALAFQDVVFSAVCVAAAAGVCFLYNKGRVRYYEILGLISGALFYTAVLSRIFMLCFCAVNTVIMKIFVRPVVKIILFIINKVAYIGNEILQVSAKIKSFLKKTAKKLSRRRKKLKKRIKML